MTIFNPIISEIDVSETLRYAGIKNNMNFPDHLSAKACDEALTRIKPKAIWHTYNYNSEQGIISANQPLKLPGSNIIEHLSGCIAVVAIAVTIGNYLEQAVTLYFKQNEYTHAILLDAAATTAVETAADKATVLINQDAQRRGLMMLPRFSPGYGDWPLTFQYDMLKLTQAHEIGITVTESSMLLPRKSITALIGLAENTASLPASHCLHQNNCSNCTQHNCLARKEN